MSESLTSDPEGYRAARNSLRKREQDFTLPGASEVQLRAGLWSQGTHHPVYSLFSMNARLIFFLLQSLKPFPSILAPCLAVEFRSLHLFWLPYPLTKQNTSFPILTPSQGNFLNSNTEQPAIFTLLGPVHLQVPLIETNSFPFT